MENEKKQDIQDEKQEEAVEVEQEVPEVEVGEQGAESEGEDGIQAISSLREENQSLKDANMRLQAEFQNYKRRTEKEKSEIYKYANEKIVVELLNVLDNMDRAIDSISHNVEDHQNVLSGVEMIKKSFEDLLQKEGVQHIEAVNQPFDPNLHHAVMTEEKDGCDPDVVIEEFQKGYKLGDKVVRPSMVKVSC